MKSRLKYSLHLCLIISALMLTACGKKENKVNSSAASGYSPFYAGGADQSIINQYQSIKANLACMNGYRLTNDVSFYVNQGAVSGTRIAGQWMPGVLNTGVANKMWVGVSAYRDLMFVTQVANGSTVIGYNVTLSFCEMKSGSSYGYNTALPSIISNERTLTNFQARYGIILDQDTYCGYGVVDLAADTTIVSGTSLSNPYTSPATIPTSYSKPTCNGKF